MRFKYNMQFQKVGDNYIGVAVGKDKEFFTEYLVLNETGYEIAVKMNNDISKEQLTDQMLESYDEDQAVMEECIDDIINYLKKHNVIWTE